MISDIWTTLLPSAPVRFKHVALLEARTSWPCTWMRTQRKFPGTPFATSLRRPHGADKQWISSWWSLKNGSYVHVICDLPPGVLKTMCVSNGFVPFCALLSFAGVSEEYWKSNGFSTFFHHVLLLNCFGSCVVERKALKRAGQLWRSGDWTPRQSSVEVGLLGVVWWQMGNQWKSHAVTSYNIAGTRFDQMGTKYSFWIIQDQNCCVGLGEKSQYSHLSPGFFGTTFSRFLSRHRSYVTEFFCTAALQPKFQLSSLTTYYIPEDGAFKGISR